MRFVQIVEFTTDNVDEMRERGRQYREQGGGGPGKAAVYKDRDKPNTYLVIAEFESYEKAMENNERPETQALSEEMGKLASGAPTFRNLDELESWE
jgi:quinol monooxygenase YgiN